LCAFPEGKETLWRTGRRIGEKKKKKKEGGWRSEKGGGEGVNNEEVSLQERTRGRRWTEAQGGARRGGLVRVVDAAHPHTALHSTQNSMSTSLS
jgi:hypothetical protein